MMIFMNEEAAYRYWVTHHRRGFVLDGRHRPRWSHLVLHRATCALIRTADARRSHWTTGSRFKAGALDREELERWVQDELERTCERCTACSPAQDDEANDPPPHLSPMAADIVDYVLEAASIHFDDEAPPYHLTIGSIASCLGKTPGQLAPTLRQVIADGYLECGNRLESAGKINPRCLVYPTPQALKNLPHYAAATDPELAAELAKLRVH